MPYKDYQKRLEYHRKYYQENKDKWKKENFCVDCKKNIWDNHLRCISCEIKRRWKKGIIDIDKMRILAKQTHTGKIVSQETRDKISKTQKGMKKPWVIERNKFYNKIDNTFRRLRNTEEFKKKMFKGMCKKPTKPEFFVIDLIKEKNLPFEYVGDGKVIISKLNPNFISTNGKKKIIEVFGRFWHETYHNVDYTRTEKGRREFLKRLGYELLVLWDDELNKQNKERVYNKINNFEVQGEFE